MGKCKILNSDLVETNLKFDNGFVEIKLRFYILDLLRIMEICKKAGNYYYYNELRWFITEIVKSDKRMGVFDFNRKLPRVKIKELKPWELEKMLLKE